MFCPRCGTENKKRVEKCEVCGISFKVKNGNKKFLKNCSSVVLWFIAIVALALSFIIAAHINSGEVSNKSSFSKLEERITKLEENNATLQEELEEVRAGVENHRHTQYELIPYYQGKSNELQFERDTVWFENGTTTQKVEVGDIHRPGAIG